MQDLVPAVFLRRRQRFFADCRLDDGRDVCAHCPNTGSMKTLLGAGRRALLRPANDPRRKLAWTLVLLEVEDGAWALVDTSLPNRIVHDGILAGRVAEIPAGGGLRREPRLESGRRLDLALHSEVGGEVLGWVEIKNVTMASATRPRRADFPDAVTSRGRAHLEELAGLAASGRRAIQFFLLGRGDCDRIGLAPEIDPDYAATLIEVSRQGVEVIAYGLDLSGGSIRLGTRVPVELE